MDKAYLKLTDQNGTITYWTGSIESRDITDAGVFSVADCLRAASHYEFIPALMAGYDNNFVQYNRTFKAKICPVFKP